MTGLKLLTDQRAGYNRKTITLNPDGSYDVWVIPEKTVEFIELYIVATNHDFTQEEEIVKTI